MKTLTEIKMKMTLKQKAANNVTNDFVHNIINRKSIKQAMLKEINWLNQPQIRQFMQNKVDYGNVCR